MRKPASFTAIMALLALAEGVDLSTVEAGEHVRFTLERGGDSIYMITGIDPVD